MEKGREYNCETHLTFRDIGKAFHSVNRFFLYPLLERTGIPRHLIVTQQCLYRQTTVTWPNLL